MPLRVWEMKRKVEKAGRVYSHTTGSHAQYVHPTLRGLVTIPGADHIELAKGTEAQHQTVVRNQMTKYAIVFEAPEREGGNWCAYAPDLPGLGVAGDTYEECRENMMSGIAFHIEGLRKHGFPVPEPTTRVEELAVAA